MIDQRLVVLGVLGSTTIASAYADNAESLEPAVAQAGQANLESIAPRDNIVVTLGIGPSFTLGFGIEDAVGRGGSATMRIAKVATPRWLVTMEVSTFASLHSFEGTLYTNTEAALSIGAQYYVRQKLWVRFAGGIGFYRGEMVALETGGRGNQDLRGLAGTAGGGLDLARWSRFVLGLEIANTSVATRDGLLSSSSLTLALSID